MAKAALDLNGSLASPLRGSPTRLTTYDSNEKLPGVGQSIESSALNDYKSAVASSRRSNTSMKNKLNSSVDIIKPLKSAGSGLIRATGNNIMGNST